MKDFEKGLRILQILRNDKNPETEGDIFPEMFGGEKFLFDYKLCGEDQVMDKLDFRQRGNVYFFL